MGTLYATRLYTTNGSLTNFEVSFDGGYIHKDTVRAEHTPTDGLPVSITITSDMWLTDSTIQITPALPAGTLRLYRDSGLASPRFTFATGTPLNKTTLDIALKQAVFCAAETHDAFTQDVTDFVQGELVGQVLDVVEDYTYTKEYIDSIVPEVPPPQEAIDVLADDGASGSLFTTVQGFIGALASSIGAGLVRFVQAGIGAILRTVQSKLQETISVKDYGATGDGVTDDYAAINKAITYALSVYARSANSIFGYFPTRKVTILFPPGIYCVSNAITPNDGSYAVCDLVGIGTATIRHIGSGACIYLNPVDPGLPLMSSPVHIKNLHIRRDSKTPGSVGIVLERMTNCVFKNVGIYGFNYGIQVLGAIDCTLDGDGNMIQNCDYGILVQQKSGFWGIMKPNLTRIRGYYFVQCAVHSIVIRRNPDESTVNNGAGGVLSIAQCNFQGAGSGAALAIQSPGEIPGKGVVNVDHCWFEGHGAAVATLQDGTAVFRNCFMVDGPSGIILQDNTSKLVLEEVSASFGASPTGNALITRADGTTAGLSAQVTSRNCTLTHSGIPAVYFGAGNVVPFTNVNADAVRTALVYSNTGTVRLAGGGGFSALISLPQGGSYILSVQQADGGIAWRGSFMLASSGTDVVSVSVFAVNVAVSTVGSTVQLENTNASAIDLRWTLLRIA